MNYMEGLRKKLKRAEDLGKMLAHLPTDECREYRDSIARSTTEEINHQKNYLTSKMDQCTQKGKAITEEISMRGDVPKGMVGENILRSLLMFVFLSFSGAGEFCLARWTIQPFGLGDLETNLLAVMVLSFTLEGMNYCLTILRKKFPASQDNLFLILGLASILLLVLIILFGAEIRQQLFHMSTLKDLAYSTEETIKSAENFYRETYGNFIALIVCLSLAVLVIGGLSWHDLKNRSFSSLSLWRLHRANRRNRRERQNLTEATINLDILLQRFLSELDFTYLHEKLIVSEKGGSSQSFFSRLQPENNKSFWRTIGVTLFFIIAVIVFFFAFKGLARSETLIFLDLSQSMSVCDYAGQETEFQKNVRGVEAYLTNISSGEDIKVICVTDRTFSSQYILLEGKITNKKDAFGQGAARDRLNLLKKWKGLKLEPKALKTDLFGAMQLAEIIFMKNSGNKRLIFFSDMRQYGQGFDFETPDVLDPNSLMREVTKKRLIASLDNAMVWCLGVHSSGKTPSYWKSLREFWTLYFQQARTKELKTFTPERRVQNE